MTFPNATSPWIEHVYHFDSVGGHEAALDVVFRHFDELFRVAHFEYADLCLRDINVEHLSTQLLSGILAATLSAKDKLPSRAALYDRIEAKWRRDETPERVERLTRGLK